MWSDAPPSRAWLVARIPDLRCCTSGAAESPRMKSRQRQMSAELFRDDDRGGQGYVLNIQRTLNPSDARVHRADRPTITGTPPRGNTG